MEGIYVVGKQVIKEVVKVVLGHVGEDRGMLHMAFSTLVKDMALRR